MIENMPRALPSLEEILDAAHVVAIPTRTRFRGVTVREAVVFAAPQGATEFSPFPEYADEEAATWLRAAIEFGWGETPAPRRDRIAVNATVPAVDAARVPEILARFPGCDTVKVKVAERGQSLEDDLARVVAVRASLGPSGTLRIDANGGWSLDEARAALEALAPFDLDYVEQPCATSDELRALRETARGLGTRIAADESVRKASDPLAVARAGAADLLVVKAQPLGGVQRALDIVTEAALPVVVSSALDTSVGISMGLHLAAALPDRLLVGACGLGTVALLDGDVTADSLVPVDGEIVVRRPRLEPEFLDRYAARPERVAWWRERIERCFASIAV